MNTLARLVVDAAHTVTGTLSHHNKPGVPRAPSFELERYLGSWHVIEAIPLAPERQAYAPVETYSRGEKSGEIKVEYRFHKGGFDGPVETKHMVADVKDGAGDAEWGIKVLGFHAQYVIAHIEPDYSAVIVARDARDHVWIMARNHVLPAAKLSELRGKVAEMGYDGSKLFFFPQSDAIA